MEAIAEAPLTKFLSRSITEPCVLLVDPFALPALRTLWKQLLGVHPGGQIVRNIVSLEDKEAFIKGDALCLDVEPVRLLVAIVTSVRGEALLAGIRSTIPHYVKLVGVTPLSSGVGMPIREVRWEEVPFCIVPQPDDTFTLTCEPCLAPTAFALNPTRPNAYELDLEKDLSSEYRAKLKRIALLLGTAISSQMNLDISDGIYSMGFGAGLLANTVNMNLSTLNDSDKGLPFTSGLKAKASLFIVDRTLDWMTPLNDRKLQPLQKLHEQLVYADEFSEIWPNIAQALENGSISKGQAVSLAFRACSLAGINADQGFSTVDQFVQHFGAERDRLISALREVATARKDCIQNAQGGNQVDTTLIERDAGIQNEPYIGATLQRIITSTPSEALPTCVVQAKKLDVAKVALNIFGSVFGGDSQRSYREQAIRNRRHLVVFFLGGYTTTEATNIKDVFRTTSPEYSVSIGGTQLLSDQDELQDQIIKLTIGSLSNAMRETSKDPRNFASLFSGE